MQVLLTKQFSFMALLKVVVTFCMASGTAASSWDRICLTQQFISNCNQDGMRRRVRPRGGGFMIYKPKLLGGFSVQVWPHILELSPTCGPNNYNGPNKHYCRPKPMYITRSQELDAPYKTPLTIYTLRPVIFQKNFVVNFHHFAPKKYFFENNSSQLYMKGCLRFLCFHILNDTKFG